MNLGILPMPRRPPNWMPPNPMIQITNTSEPPGGACLTCLRPLSEHRLECPGHELLELLWPPNNPSFGTDGIHTLGMERDFLILTLEYLRLSADELQKTLYTSCPHRTLHLPQWTEPTKMLFPNWKTWVYHWSGRWRRPTRRNESWGLRFGRSGVAIVVEQVLPPVPWAVRPSIAPPYDFYVPPGLDDPLGIQAQILGMGSTTQPEPEKTQGHTAPDHQQQQQQQQQVPQEPKEPSPRSPTLHPPFYSTSPPPPEAFSIGLPLPIHPPFPHTLPSSLPPHPHPNSLAPTPLPLQIPTLPRSPALTSLLTLRTTLEAEISAREHNEANLTAAAILARRIWGLSLDRADPMWRVVADLREAVARERADLEVARRNLGAVGRGVGVGCFGGEGDVKEGDGGVGGGGGNGGNEGDNGGNRRWKGKEKETDESDDYGDEVCIWTSRQDFVAACDAEWLRWRAVGGQTPVVVVRLQGEKPVLAVRWRLSG